MCLSTTSSYTECSVKANQFNLAISYQHLLICLIGPRGSDKYSSGDLELLLWISILIGFRLDLTDLASPRRGTASSQGQGCWGKHGKEREEKRESGFKKRGGIAGWMLLVVVG